ncbi:MAG: hypothetical protein AAF361_05915 [Bacteroidota bacterium]
MRRYGYIWILSFCLACGGDKEIQPDHKVSEVRLISEQKVFVAGSEIALQFESSTKGNPLLLFENALGGTLLRPETQENILKFSLPLPYSQKAGLSRWKLLEGQKEIISGQIHISSSPEEQPLLEAYLGPPSLMAGDKDFAMLVTIPTDRYDNPLTSNWPISLKQNKEGLEKSDSIFTQDLLSWKRINTVKRSGPLFVSAATELSQTKEFQTFIYPANPIDFEIMTDLVHNYADGNQIMQLKTSVLRDEFGNTSSDGTLVEFHIQTDSGSILSSTATTINGVATAKMLHPEHASEWEITAFVAGAAKSNSLSVQFQSIFNDFDVQILEKGRLLRVGLLKSYLGQIVPDGFQVVLTVWSEDNEAESLATNSRNGYAEFKLDVDAYPSGLYQLELVSGGVIKKITQQLDE